MYYRTSYRSPIGALTLAGSDENLIGLWIDGQKYYGDTLPKEATETADTPVFRETRNWLDGYFAGKKPSVSALPLDPFGSAFRQAVWRILRAIPYGEVRTYGDIARAQAEKPGRTGMSAQAVGGAVGHNPISIIIPCHRVVGANGSLTGYAGGIGTKLRLLALEGVDVSCLFIPKNGTAL
ncbi:MAG: methylated-DNA--[protein]-cysteine S-methyltransferase [Clostridiales Family XIII bacterium]|jgi:methylated-DNA-[protein]-cysteine S-methyltransferase|nr:methylated-DNA--[protein]-cysteine S-methyltransferase [Clostridiales Family XIII bacterium]